MDTPYENARASTFHTSTPSNRARRRRALGDDDDEHSPRNHVHELHHIPSTNNLRRHPPHHGRGVRRAIHPDDDRASRRRPRPRRSLTLARVSARAPFATRAVARASRARTRRARVVRGRTFHRRPFRYRASCTVQRAGVARRRRRMTTWS